LHKAGVVDLLDVAFGKWIAARGDETVGLAAALVSAEVAKGHVCLDLASAIETLRANGISPPSDWRKKLTLDKTVAKPGSRAPLVLDGGRLYLHRYWHYETDIADALRKRSAPHSIADEAAVKNVLQELFPDLTRDKFDRQALAAAIGATRGLTIISGGPGTGKTTTIVKLIQLLRRLDPNLAVALAAPTGKAASRLSDALANGWPRAEASLDAAPQTLHRLLGYNSATQQLVHHAENPLAADLVVVDEASMVDVGLMARLLAALKPDARLVLVGDRNQLASVEAGAVFGDICQSAAGFPAADAGQLEALLGKAVPIAEGDISPLSGNIALLKRNYRFGDSGIGALARAVVAGNAEAALDLLRSKAQAAWRPLASENALLRNLERMAATQFKPIINAATGEEALARLDRFRLLAAERRGPFGVEGLNARIEQLLRAPSYAGGYKGRPVLISENDYELALFNGDFGIIWPDEDNAPKLWLRGNDAALRKIPIARLPAHETAWALTVHKAQGSEFERIALVLPPRESAVATRELIYTGITRAREAIEVWANEDALRRAITRRIRRASGLADRLA
jgi:exodeoxyribonuclease V alpha subunit